MMRTRHICGMLLTMLLLAPVGAATDGRQGGGVECETTITVESFQASSISIPNGRCVEIDLGTLEEEPCWNSTSMRAEAMPSTSFSSMRTVCRSISQARITAPPCPCRCPSRTSVMQPTSTGELQNSDRGLGRWSWTTSTIRASRMMPQMVVKPSSPGRSHHSERLKVRTRYQPSLSSTRPCASRME